MRYRVSIFRESRHEEEFENDNGQRYMFLNIEKPIRNKYFAQFSRSKKKKFVKGFLKTLVRSDIRSDVELKRKERVLVNRQGYYGVDAAVFDEEVSLPQHLVSNQKNVPKRSLHG